MYTPHNKSGCVLRNKKTELVMTHDIHIWQDRSQVGTYTSKNITSDRDFPWL